MKVLQIIQRCQLRGAEIFACQLSMELMGRGVEVDVAYLFDSNDLLKESFPELRFIDLGGRKRSRLLDLPAYRRLAGLIRKNKYDIVQANAGDTLKYAATSRFLFRWNAQLVFRNANLMSDFVRGKIHLMLNKAYLSSCTYFISVSENCRQDLIRLFPPASAISETVTIGTYLQAEPQQKSNDPQKEPVLLNVASLVPEKNQLFLLDIFHTFYSTHKRGYLWIAGEGNMREDLERKITSLGLSDRVKLLGARKDVRQLFSQADVFILPSKTEGLPAVILEAFSADVPVIAAPVGGIPDVIRHEVNGFLVEACESTTWMKFIEKVLFDEEVRQRITTNAFRTISTEFLMPEIAGRFHKAYAILINTGDKEFMKGHSSENPGVNA